MKKYYCACGNILFFENTHCSRCGRYVGFNPDKLSIISLPIDQDDRLVDNDAANYKYCKNFHDYNNCNWLLDANSNEAYCISCRLNRTIPNLSSQQNRIYWSEIEKAKRRLIYTLLALNLPVRRKTDYWPNGIEFDFIEDNPIDTQATSQRVLTGHHGGVITINIAEADDVNRVMTRKMMNEAYRTLLGHFRHESGHYYYDYLVNNQSALADFKSIFGDPSADYQSSLSDYYINGPRPDWHNHYISAYASAHPYEDWAECWAHVLHIADTLETASHFGMIDFNVSFQNFEEWIKQWDEVSVILNEMNRSMGTRDAYPFTISSGVANKLAFICQLLVRLHPAN